MHKIITEFYESWCSGWCWFKPGFRSFPSSLSFELREPASKKVERAELLPCKKLLLNQLAHRAKCKRVASETMMVVLTIVISLWTRIEGSNFPEPSFIFYNGLGQTLQECETGLTSQFLTLTLIRPFKELLGQLSKNGVGVRCPWRQTLLKRTIKGGDGDDRGVVCKKAVRGCVSGCGYKQ